ncbi:glycosyltransferase involved in cell wall biosynthesis [Catalinimonas alkaloidigena]|uniref:glycosyltransferase family 2 protein n=1 Tax=Catalinimonas alkaloidigena TaxID=1075417 RepID=UPI0024064463|nr:glycosyltransferase family 2 protein [Catalinimonas alkaloidigena]MDF9795706.1 glycosyltransferase involved in cell wall biosynthesis [Catalinimonas alkaloidigena]
MKLSLVITLYNEEDNVQPLLKRIEDALQGLEYEVLLVDDGSTDRTVFMVKKYANENVRLIVFNRNHGQTTAMSAGIHYAKGEYIVTMDGDLQNDPLDIPAMLDKIENEGWGLVAGKREKRKDGFILRKFPSKIANAIIRKLTGVYISDYGCSLKIFRSDIAHNLGLYGELHRFIPVLAKLQGASVTEMSVRHHPRIYGQSKYGLGRTFRVVSDLMLMLFFQKYIQKPMHLFGTMGIISFFLGAIINFYMLIEKFLGHDIWGRPLLLLGVVLVIGGIQLVTFGFMAELIMRTYFESQNKTPYRVKEVFIGKATSTTKSL